LIVQRYLFRELALSLVAVLGVLVLIYVSNRLVRFLAEAAAGQLASDAILELLALKAIGHITLLMPLALYLAVLLGLGRLYRDSEVVAMSAGGIGVRRLAQTIVGFSFLFALLAALLTLYFAPEIAVIQETLRKRAQQESTVAAIIPGRFKQVGGTERVLYVESVDRDAGLLRNVFVESPGGRGRDLLIGSRAYQRIQGKRASRYMIIEDGYRYAGRPGDADFVITRFKRHAVRLDEGDTAGYLKAESIPTAELLGSNDPRLLAELQWRISLPLSVLILGLLAVPLARTSPRQGRFAKLFSAVLVYFVYNNALGVARKLVERGDLSPLIGLWPVHAVVVAVAVALLWRHSRGRWDLFGFLRRDGARI